MFRPDYAASQSHVREAVSSKPSSAMHTGGRSASRSSTAPLSSEADTLPVWTSIIRPRATGLPAQRTITAGRRRYLSSQASLFHADRDLARRSRSSPSLRSRNCAHRRMSRCRFWSEADMSVSSAGTAAEASAGANAGWSNGSSGRRASLQPASGEHQSKARESRLAATRSGARRPPALRFASRLNNVNSTAAVPAPQKSGLPKRPIRCPNPCASASSSRLCATFGSFSDRPILKSRPLPTSTKGILSSVCEFPCPVRSSRRSACWSSRLPFPPGSFVSLNRFAR